MATSVVFFKGLSLCETSRTLPRVAQVIEKSYNLISTGWPVLADPTIPSCSRKIEIEYTFYSDGILI